MHAFQLVFLTVGLLPVDTVADDRVDVVHHNHHYSDDGQLVVEQVWWEDWRESAGEHAIIGWRLARPGTPHSPIPHLNAAGEWEALWLDGDVLRRIRARSFRQSWTQGQDRELLDRDRNPDWRTSRREFIAPSGRLER
jgi:hypothetical protein